MKKTLITLMVVICSLAMTANGQILNPGFESWTSGNPDNWATSNAFPAGLINITQTSDSHSGSSAVLGSVVNYFGTPIGPVIQSGPGATGFAISEQYQNFELWYKFTSVGGDKFSVNVGLEKGGNTIAQGIAALPSTVTSYTHLTVPMHYTTNDVPDLAIIQISITGPVTGNDVHVGSLMYVDDLSFSFFTGAGNFSNSDLAGKCYPNPASGLINIPLGKNVSGGIIFSVFDSYGREVKKIHLQQQQDGSGVFQFSVEDLSMGFYFYSLDFQNSHYSGKFTVSR